MKTPTLIRASMRRHTYLTSDGKEEIEVRVQIADGTTVTLADKARTDHEAERLARKAGHKPLIARRMMAVDALHPRHWLVLTS